jgi:hypothetical protein
MRRTMLAMAVFALCMPVILADAKGKRVPDATIKLSEGSVAAGVGLSWGKGTLTYKGKSHAISVSGLDVGSVGVSQVSATGNVYHLKKLEDFNGTYAAAAAAATVGGGAGAAALQNQNGVEIHLTSTSRGVKLTAGASGVKMELKE